MGTGEHGDDLPLARPSGAPEEDLALRQLRRRYEHLRREYEQLLDRLGDIEDRLDEAHQPVATSAPAQLDAAIVDPLIRLRAEYSAAAARIQGIVAGLDRIAAGAMKGQHAAAPTGAVAPAATEPDAQREQKPTPAEPDGEEGEAPRPRKVSVDVHGKGFGELLDFQEKLSSVAGVSRVSINAIDAERATLIVELTAGGSHDE